MNKKARVWIALGSNLGDSKGILQQAWKILGEEAGITLVSLSRPYLTEPVGMESENLFFNGVGILETDLTPELLLGMLQQVEKRFGRMSKTGENGYQDRMLDLDILYFDDCILNGSFLVLPHPHISERLFVLAPLAEIDPQHRDPCTGLSAKNMHQKLLQRMTDGHQALQTIKPDNWD